MLSLNDVVDNIYPLLQGFISTKSMSKQSEEKTKTFAVLSLSRKLRPLLRLYLDVVKSYLLQYYQDNPEKTLALSKLTDYSDLPGRLIGIVGNENETWRMRLVRLKEASHLINLENPSDEQLAALISPSGPGILLACAAAQEMFRQRKLSHFHHHHQDLANPFAALSDPFVELKDEIEVGSMFTVISCTYC